MFDMDRFANRLAGRLSGGMKQKLALACAFVPEPRVLLLDEPTTGVDPVSRREFWDTLAHLAADGLTILVATPYLDEAERCHRVALMHHGQIQQIGHAGRVRASLLPSGWKIRTANLGEAEQCSPRLSGPRRTDCGHSAIRRPARSSRCMIRKKRKRILNEALGSTGSSPVEEMRIWTSQHSRTLFVAKLRGLGQDAPP